MRVTVEADVRCPACGIGLERGQLALHPHCPATITCRTCGRVNTFLMWLRVYKVNQNGKG